MMVLPEIAELVLDAAKANGATAADVVIVRGKTLTVGVRCGATEKVLQAEEKQLGLRVWIGKRSAVAATSNLAPGPLREFAASTCALAKVVADDEYSGLPSLEECAPEVPELQLFDSRVEDLSPDEARKMAERAENTALGYDSRIINSEGAECSTEAGETWYASSTGFAAGYRSSVAHISVVPVAKGSQGLQRDYWYSQARHLEDLGSAEEVGHKAAQRTLRRLEARSITTCEVPVVFDPEAAATLLAHLAQAVVGQSIFRGMSFLAGRLGERIAPEFVNIIDDGRIPSALGSKPFDAEGVPTRRTAIVEEGQLRSYLLDCYAARRLGFSGSTGSASRAVGSTPVAAPTNFFLVPGKRSAEEIIATVKRGLYVTNLIGFGVNLTTGDYSRGASGLWIEDGQLAFPVEEITVAGNLLEMFARIEAIGSDLELRRSIASPTILIGRLTVAGRG